jgi:hypothetical protein
MKPRDQILLQPFQRPYLVKPLLPCVEVKHDDAAND